MWKIQNKYPTNYKSFKIRFVLGKVDEISPELQQNELITHYSIKSRIAILKKKQNTKL